MEEMTEGLAMYLAERGSRHDVFPELNDSCTDAQAAPRDSAALEAFIDDHPTLGPQIRHLSRLRHYSIEDVSKHLGIPPSLLRSHITQALGSLCRMGAFSIQALHESRKLYNLADHIHDAPDQIGRAAVTQSVEIGRTLAERLRREPRAVYQLEPREFVLIIAELLDDLGYRIECRPATRDGGQDLFAYLDTELGTLLHLVEVKRYRHDHKIGVGLVRSLYGTVVDAQASHGVLVTSSTFSADARKFQHRHRHLLSLKDYGDVEGWIKRYRGSRRAV